MEIDNEKFDLYRKYFSPRNLSELAFSYHLEADWYRKIVMRWVRAGRIVLFASIGFIVGINSILSLVFTVKGMTIWVMVNSSICIASLYLIQIIGKQIVATRDIVATFSERTLYVQSLLCIVDEITSDEIRENILVESLEQLGSKYVSPFQREGVAYDASLGFAKDLGFVQK